MIRLNYITEIILIFIKQLIFNLFSLDAENEIRTTEIRRENISHL
jgi:hypothetical protein